MNRVHPTCTERQSLNKECGWKGGDRSGLAQGQELTGRKRKNILTRRKREKQKNTLDSYRPSHGRTLPLFPSFRNHRKINRERNAYESPFIRFAFAYWDSRMDCMCENAFYSCRARTNCHTPDGGCGPSAAL